MCDVWGALHEYLVHLGVMPRFFLYPRVRGSASDPPLSAGGLRAFLNEQANARGTELRTYQLPLCSEDERGTGQREEPAAASPSQRVCVPRHPTAEGRGHGLCRAGMRSASAAVRTSFAGRDAPVGPAP